MAGDAPDPDALSDALSDAPPPPDAPPDSRLRRALPWLPLAALLAVVAAPAARDPAGIVLGTPWVDGYGTLWFYFLTGEILAGRQGFAHTDLLFHPWGKDVYAHTGGNLLDALIAQPLAAALGPAGGYNAWLLLLLASNYAAGLHLARRLGAPPARAWIAGLALAANPYVLLEWAQGRPTQAWLALPALALAHLWTMRSAPQAVLAGLCVALSGLQYWYYGMLIGGIALLDAALALLAPLRPDPASDRPPDLADLALSRPAILLRYAIAGATCLAVALPAAMPMLDALRLGAVPGLADLSATSGPLAPLSMRTEQGDRLGFFVLSVTNGTTGSIVDEDGLRFIPTWPALPWGWWLLAAVAGASLLRSDPRAPCARRITLRLLLWIAAGLLIAAGPGFVIGDRLLANPAYMALLDALPPIRRWWWPGRAVAAALIAWAALIGLARPPDLPARWAARLPAGIAPALWAALAAASVAGTSLAAGIAPAPGWSARPPPALQCLAAAPPGAVIDLPFVMRQENLYDQVLHKKPILGGMLMKGSGFVPPEVTALRRDNRLLAALIRIGDRDYTAERPAPGADRAAAEADRALSRAQDRAALAALGYRYVLARKQKFERPDPRRRSAAGADTPGTTSDWPRAARLLASELGPPAREDDRLALWTLDGQPVDCP